jgi:hypothetical protein
MLFIVTIVLVLTSCSSNTAYQISKPDQFPILRATGYAIISRQPGPTNDEKTLQAMRASKLDAYRELSEQVYGQTLIADTNLKDNIELSDQLKARTAGVIKGARVVRMYPIDNTYITELELDSKVLYDIYKLRGAL